MNLHKFLFDIYAMKYAEAKKYMNDLISCTQKLEDVARSYQIHAIRLKKFILSIVDNSEEQFCTKRNRFVYNERFYITDKELLVKGLNLVLAAHGNTFVCKLDADDNPNTYTISFEDATIVAGGSSEVGICIHVFNARVSISNPLGTKIFVITCSPFLHRRFSTLHSYMEKVIDEILRETRSYSRQRFDDIMHVIRSFCFIWPPNTVQKMYWADAFQLRALSEENSDRMLSKKDLEFIECFSRHPDVLKYEEADGTVYYMTSTVHKNGCLLFVVERSGDAFRLAGTESRLYERWQFMMQLVG